MNSPARIDTTRSDPMARQEVRLRDQIERLGRHRAGRKFVHLHLSKLKSYNRRDYHSRIAINTFENMMTVFGGELYKLSNNDVAFIFAATDPLQVEEAMQRVAYLFTDDPLNDQPDPDLIANLCTWYDVERDYDDLIVLTTRLCEDAMRRARRGNSLAKPETEELEPVDPHRLGALIDAIASADLSNLMRRQIVYAMLSNRPPHPLFSELFISISDLQRLILPDHDITANRWLFQNLTETLDRRMLSLLLRNDDPAIAASFSLNLNVATLVSPEFLTFDASLKPGARGTIVIEIKLIDIYADIAAYAFARDFMHDRGYRLCLDSVSAFDGQFIDRAKLGLDLIKLDWADISKRPLTPEYTAMMRAMVEQAGRSKVIFCHVDTEEGLKFGQSIGIAMFQGRHIDQLANGKHPGARPR